MLIYSKLHEKNVGLLIYVMKQKKWRNERGDVSSQSEPDFASNFMYMLFKFSVPFGDSKRATTSRMSCENVTFSFILFNSRLFQVDGDVQIS